MDDETLIKLDPETLETGDILFILIKCFFIALILGSLFFILNYAQDNIFTVCEINQTDGSSRITNQANMIKEYNTYIRELNDNRLTKYFMKPPEFKYTSIRCRFNLPLLS